MSDQLNTRRKEVSFFKKNLALTKPKGRNLNQPLSKDKKIPIPGVSREGWQSCGKGCSSLGFMEIKGFWKCQESMKGHGKREEQRVFQQDNYGCSYVYVHSWIRT